MCKWYALLHYKEIPDIYWMTLVCVIYCMGCVSVREIIHELQLVDYLPYRYTDHTKTVLLHQHVFALNRVLCEIFDVKHWNMN